MFTEVDLLLLSVDLYWIPYFYHRCSYLRFMEQEEKDEEKGRKKIRKFLSNALIKRSSPLQHTDLTSKLIHSNNLRKDKKIKKKVLRIKRDR